MYIVVPMIMTMMMKRGMRPAQSMSEVMVTPPELIAEVQTESETIGTCKSSNVKLVGLANALM